MLQNKTNETANAIRKMVVGCIVVEYSMLQLKDNTKQDLKNRVNAVLNACKRVQDWFVTHPNSTQEHREVFKREFLSSEILLISELLEMIWGISEDGLETIISAIKEAQLAESPPNG